MSFRVFRSVSLETLFGAFHSLTDSRTKKGRRHSLRTCLAVVACGILAGEGVKENQGQLLKDIESMFTASIPADSINFEEKRTWTGGKPYSELLSV